MASNESLDQLRIKALKSIRLKSSTSSESLPIKFTSTSIQNEAFTNPSHPLYPTAAILLEFREEFSTVVELLTSFKLDDQRGLDKEIILRLLKELFHPIKDGSLTYDDLEKLGFHGELLESIKSAFAQYLPSGGPLVAIELSSKKRKLEVLDESRLVTKDVVSPPESTTNATFVFDLSSDDDDDEIDDGNAKSRNLELNFDDIFRKLNYGFMERSMTDISNSIYAKQTQLESLTSSVAVKLEQQKSLYENKNLIEERKLLCTARIVQYNELITAYRAQLTKILGQIAELERSRLHLQASVDQNEAQYKACIIAKQGDESKLVEFEKKAADVASILSIEQTDIANIQEWLLNANHEISIKRNLLDVGSLEDSSPLPTANIIELIQLKKHRAAPGAQVEFFHEYSPDYYQVESDLISLHHLWKIPEKDPDTIWKEKVLQFAREVRNSMPICQLENMNGQCTNDKCQDLHFADLEGSGMLSCVLIRLQGDQLALRLVLQSLNSSERSQMKDSVAKISTSSVSEYLTTFLKIPVVENSFKKMMETRIIENESVKFTGTLSTSMPHIGHNFITPVLREWSLAALDLSKYPRIEIVEFDAKSVDAWIARAVSVLPDRFSFTPALLKDSILVCLEGLQLKGHVKSEKLRSFFLDLLQAHTTSEEKILELFTSAVKEIPTSLHLKWMFSGFVRDPLKKQEILAEIIELALTGSSERNSSTILNCLMQIFIFAEPNLSASCYSIITGSDEIAYSFRQPGAVIRSNLTAEHYTILSLSFVAYLLLGYLPLNIYMLQNLIVSSTLFLIPWKDVQKSDEINFVCDEIFQISLKHVLACSGGKLNRRAIVCLIRNRVAFLKHCLHLNGRQIVRVLNEYIVQFPSKELLDLKGLYLAECGLFQEAKEIFQEQYPESLNSEIIIEMKERGLDGVIQFLQALKLESFKATKIRPFTANIQAIHSIILNGGDVNSRQGNFSAREILTKEHLVSTSPAAKVFILSQILYLLSGDLSRILETVHRLIQDAKVVEAYPFVRTGSSIADVEMPSYFAFNLDHLVALVASSCDVDTALMSIVDANPTIALPIRLLSKASPETQRKLSELRKGII